jgi:hypothetical protein
MSDRVLYPVGNTKIRNYIYQPTMLRADLDAFLTAISYPVTASVLCPTGLTLDQIMALSWRISKWTLSGNIAIAYPGFYTISGPVTGVCLDPIANRDRDIVRVFRDGTSTLTTPPTRLGPPSLGNGGNLVIVSGGTMTWISIPPTFTDTDTLEGSMTLLLINDGIIGLQPVIYDPDTELFYPPIDVNFGAFPFSLDHKLNIRTAGWLPAPRTASTLTIDPVIAPSFTIPIEFKITPAAPSITTNTMTLTATEFLAYSTKSGAPVYDTVTGTQINDPFS